MEQDKKMPQTDKIVVLKPDTMAQESGRDDLTLASLAQPVETRLPTAL